MAKSINALYEDGVFKPLSKVRLKNRQRVKLTVVKSEKSSNRIARSQLTAEEVEENKRSAVHYVKNAIRYMGKAPEETTERDKPKNRRSKRRRVEITSSPGYQIVGLFRSGVHDLSKNHDKSCINGLEGISGYGRLPCVRRRR